jgi:galactitol-specific phosphotransferase system IIB component
MVLKRIYSSGAAIAVACGLMLSGPAMAEENVFSALRGIDAQALSVEEMQAITGELNAYDIAAALTAVAANLGERPRLQTAALNLAQYYLDHAVDINNVFAKNGVLTACKSCP